MAKILVSGLINVETTLKVDSFPIAYSPVRYPFYGINSTVSGVGYNLTKALTILGDQVDFLSLIGADAAGNLVRAALNKDNLPSAKVLGHLGATAQSVILYDGSGRRQINVDLKDIQEQAYPPDTFNQAISICDLAILCNINFSRPYLQIARQRGCLVATDVHTISNLEDTYNRDFMQYADILFLSDENLQSPPEIIAREAMERFGNEIVVVGMGAAGALLASRQEAIITRFPAVKTRPVVNSIGAGDALFSSFIHFYLKSRDAESALQRAMLFASYKIGTSGAAEGFLTEAELEKLVQVEWN